MKLIEKDFKKNSLKFIKVKFIFKYYIYLTFRTNFLESEKINLLYTKLYFLNFCFFKF